MLALFSFAALVVASRASVVIDVELRPGVSPDFLVVADVDCGGDVEALVGSILAHTVGTWELTIPVGGCDADVEARSVAAVGRWLKTTYTGRLSSPCPSGLARATVTNNESDLLGRNEKFRLTVRAPVSEFGWNEWLALPLVLFDDLHAVVSEPSSVEGKTRVELDAGRSAVSVSTINTVGTSGLVAVRGGEDGTIRIVARYGLGGFSREVTQVQLDDAWRRVNACILKS